MPASERQCICSRFAAVTEAAALAAADWMGKSDGPAASRAAREAMAGEMECMPLRARVVAGRGGGPACDSLNVGDEVGRELGPWVSGLLDGGEWSEDASAQWDVAVDPLQAPEALARGVDGAMAVIAAGPAGSLLPVPEMYMQKLIVPATTADALDLDAAVGDNVRAVAQALGRRAEDVIVVVLDRPRHGELIQEIRETGARVRLITDGDISAGLAVVSGDAGVDMYIGIGGSTEAILAAAALRCLGGGIQARFWPVSRHQVEMVRAAGIEDLESCLTVRDLAGDGVLLSATAVTGGRFLKATTHRSDGIATETMVLCSRCHAVRKIQTLHRAGNEGPQVQLGAR